MWEVHSASVLHHWTMSGMTEAGAELLWREEHREHMVCNKHL